MQPCQTRLHFSRRALELCLVLAGGERPGLPACRPMGRIAGGGARRVIREPAAPELYPSLQQSWKPMP